ncbi:MAG: alpha/beta hydrolase, partial [Treponema sp.]|nr:alpha/beta hydrolase [Treponema sp.]
PEDPEAKPDTVILYIHGGAWITGDKTDSPVEEIRRIAADKGCVAASMNYRLLYTADCDDMLDDVDRAISRIKERTNSLGFKINKLVLVGVSAGAHLSLLYSYQHNAGGASPAPIPIVLCISLCGPADFTDSAWYDGSMPADPVLGNMLSEPSLKVSIISGLTGEAFTEDDYAALQSGSSLDAAKREALERISPIRYVGGDSPATILAHGEKDGIVPFSNAERLKAKLDEAGVAPVSPDRFTVFPNSGHTLQGDPDKLTDLFAVINGYIGTL